MAGCIISRYAHTPSAARSLCSKYGSKVERKTKHIKIMLIAKGCRYGYWNSVIHCPWRWFVFGLRFASCIAEARPYVAMTSWRIKRVINKIYINLLTNSIIGINGTKTKYVFNITLTFRNSNIPFFLPVYFLSMDLYICFKWNLNLRSLV